MTRQERKRRDGLATSRSKAPLIIGIILVVALIAFFAVYFMMKNAVDKVASDVIWNNIYIENVDVSGKNSKQAEEELNALVAEYKAQKVKLTAEEAEAEATLEELGFKAKDIEKQVKEAVSYGKKGSVWKRYQMLKDLEEKALKLDVSYEVDAETIEKMISEKFAELDGAAVNATIKREGGQFVITDGKSGVKVDLETSVQNIVDHYGKSWESKESETLELVTTVDEPDVTKEDLQQIKDVLGTFSTTYAHNSARGTNVIKGTSGINGTVLFPGEVISASDAMGPRTAENGYKMASSYVNGEVVDGMGGGICQVSTTLYNAAILAELEIVERSPHSMVVSYVEPSMDAAISQGHLDLKIKNNTEYPIYIEGLSINGTLTFNVYGKETRAASRKVSFVSETLSNTDPGKRFVETADPIGTYKRSAAAHNGIKARLWKVVTENGQEVSREKFNSSNYKASKATWSVGVGTDNAEAAAIIRNAIATQDEATITAAIAQAQALVAAAAAPPTAEAPAAETPAAETPTTETAPEVTP